MKKSKSNHLNKTLTYKHIYFFIVLVALAFFMLSFSKAKYVKNEEETDSYVAKTFYFESNLLTTSKSDNTYVYGEGENTITFTIANYEDELRISEVDIYYTATLTDINGNTIETKSGTLTQNELLTDTVTFENLETGTYNVTVNSTSPYTKTLQGTFYITAKDENISQEVSDTENSAMLYLTISTKDYEGDVLITYPEGLAIDNTDTHIENLTNSTVTINFETNSEYAIIFFKEDITKTYTTSDFTVVKKEI